MKNKKKYLDFVYLTPEEYDKLKTRLGSLLPDYLERLNLYLGSIGKRYKSHYFTILNWWRRDGKPEAPEIRDRRLKEAAAAKRAQIEKKPLKLATVAEIAEINRKAGIIAKAKRPAYGMRAQTFQKRKQAQQRAMKEK